MKYLLSKNIKGTEKVPSGQKVQSITEGYKKYSLTRVEPLTFKFIQI